MCDSAILYRDDTEDYQIVVFAERMIYDGEDGETYKYTKLGLKSWYGRFKHPSKLHEQIYNENHLEKFNIKHAIEKYDGEVYITRMTKLNDITFTGTGPLKLNGKEI